MNIEPRKPSDKGGFLCMPRCDTMPEGLSGWIKVACPVCGDPCWKRPDDDVTITICGLDGAACTVCALKMGG